MRVFALLLFLFPCTASAQESLLVTERWLGHANLENALYDHLAAEAEALLDARAARIASLRNAEDWKARQSDIGETLERIVGSFPAKTPLNARVMNVVEKADYRIENLVFESRPAFYVTASLFIPNGLSAPAPAIVYTSGHYPDGYHGEVYRSVCANLASKGFVVLAFDPLGQGERIQYYDSSTGGSRVGIGVPEHSYAGAQAFVAGSSIAHYFAWDGIRAVDYLLTRAEVDPKRIGITGHSGGGTQAALVAALDERIYASAVQNYITSQRRLFESIGPQDAEQNLYHGIANGIEHADLLTVRAPRPALIVSTTDDFFSIQGARETFEEVSRAYEALGGSIRMVVDTAPHDVTKRNREAIYAFFQEVLSNPGSSEDRAVPELSAEDTRVTPTGQVASSLGGVTVSDLVRREAERLPAFDGNRPQAARRLSGYRDPESVGEPVFTGRIERNGYAVEKYFLEGERDYVIPYLLMVPEGSGPFPAVVYLHPDGKAAVGDSLVRAGLVVLAPDLIGTGETGLGAIEGNVYHLPMGDAAFNVWFAGVQVGRSIVGVRAGDLVRLARVLERREDVLDVSGVAEGAMGPVLLHAAAFEPAISRAVLLRPLVSYASFATSPFYRPEFIHATVPGALTAYDLPDLAASLAPRPLAIVGAVDAWGEPVSNMTRAFEAAVKAYEAQSHGLRIVTSGDSVRLSELLRQ